MNWDKYHTESEHWAQRGNAALRSGDAMDARQWYNWAAVKEEDALDSVDPHAKRRISLGSKAPYAPPLDYSNCSRTFYVTLISTVHLYNKAGKAGRSRELAKAFAGLPEWVREEIKEFL